MKHGIPPGRKLRWSQSNIRHVHKGPGTRQLGIGGGGVLPAEGETGNHFPQPVMLLVEAEKLPVRLSPHGVCSPVS